MIKLPDVKVGQTIRIMTMDEILTVFGELPCWINEGMHDLLGRYMTVEHIMHIPEHIECNGVLYETTMFNVWENHWFWRCSHTDLMFELINQDDTDYDGGAIDAFLEGLQR